jgi:hypothetical protein
MSDYGPSDYDDSDIGRAVREQMETIMPKFDDAYWLRMFSMAAMQSIIQRNGVFTRDTPRSDINATWAVESAQSLLDEIKRVESENKQGE